MEPPEFDDEPDDDELAGQGGDDSGRARSRQGDDEATAGGTDDLTEEPDADAADALFAVAVPDR